MFEKVNNDLVAAMKSGDKFTLSVLRMLKSAIIYEQTNGEKHELTDDDIMSVIKKQVKTRKTSMEEYLSYDRKDLADNLQKEIDILSKYLPEELSDEELTKIIDEIIALVGLHLIPKFVNLYQGQVDIRCEENDSK